MSSRPTTPPRQGIGAFVYRLFVAIVELMIVRGKPRRVLEAEVIAPSPGRSPATNLETP
jgi:hypothetical protein